MGPSQQSARTEAIAVPSGSQNTIYAGPGAGNIWKSIHNGLTWQPIFEHESALAIGDIAAAPSHADMCAGTGEAQPRSSGYSFAGTGVFKSIHVGPSFCRLPYSGTHRIYLRYLGR